MIALLGALVAVAVIWWVVRRLIAVVLVVVVVAIAGVWPTGHGSGTRELPGVRSLSHLRHHVSHDVTALVRRDELHHGRR